jgi:hypothetical protein
MWNTSHAVITDSAVDDPERRGVKSKEVEDVKNNNL